jgi:hypothetical protein
LLFAYIHTSLADGTKTVGEMEASDRAAVRDTLIAQHGPGSMTIIADPPKGEREPEPAPLPRVRAIPTVGTPRTVRRFGRAG